MKPWKAKADESPLAVHKETAIADVDVEARNFRRVDPLPASECKRPGGPWDRTDWTCIRHPETDKTQLIAAAASATYNAAPTRTPCVDCKNTSEHISPDESLNGARQAAVVVHLSVGIRNCDPTNSASLDGTIIEDRNRLASYICLSRTRSVSRNVGD